MGDRRTQRSRRLAKIVAAAASLSLSLVVAELCVAKARHDAYPFLNIFQNDERYGVVLQPSATTRVFSRKGRVTEIATNALGFRGRQWTVAPAGGRVTGRTLLIGDSQVLGYNVAREQTFAPALELLTGCEVLNAAVPTWGPTEYVYAIEDLAPTFRPEVVIFVANLANDWFEAFVPNNERTHAVDGWASYSRQDESKPFPFWGRAWLFGRSQLVLLARELWAHSYASFTPPAENAEILLRDVDQIRMNQGGDRSRLTTHLRSAAATCERWSCRVIVACLPIDVQVDAREWLKYRGARKDLTKTEVLCSDLREDATKLGIHFVDLLPALRMHSPGMFLDDDYHLSPAGHRVVAEALAPLVRKAAPVPAERPSL